jgi:hypothetical protein
LEHRTQQRRVVFLWIKEAKLNLELFLCTLRLFQWDVFRRIIRFILALLIISLPFLLLLLLLLLLLRWRRSLLVNLPSLDHARVDC